MAFVTEKFQKQRLLMQEVRNTSLLKGYRCAERGIYPADSQKLHDLAGDITSATLHST